MQIKNISYKQMAFGMCDDNPCWVYMKIYYKKRNKLYICLKKTGMIWWMKLYGPFLGFCNSLQWKHKHYSSIFVFQEPKGDEMWLLLHTDPSENIERHHFRLWYCGNQNVTDPNSLPDTVKRHDNPDKFCLLEQQSESCTK